MSLDHRRRGGSRTAPIGDPSLNHRPNPTPHRRRSIRLRGYDYTQDGAYYVTIVTQGRRTLFGDIVEGEMQLNDTGQLIANAWEWLATRYPHVELDSYVVMPNHLHGIIVITSDHRRGGSRTARARTAPTRRKPLGRLIGAFKTVSTKQVNLAHGTPGRLLWQRNYYEHVIRDDEEWNQVREYIAGNPMQWEMDAENPNVP